VLLYKASQAVLDAAGPECDPPEKKQQLDDSKERVKQKIEDAENQRDAQQPDQGDGEPDSQDQQLQDLQDQQGQADQEKADEQSQDRGADGGGSSVEKPW
jgi:hypothetical protein